MALSKSIQKAQLPLACELCEIETKIQWKCIDCNLLICDKCKNKVHSKFKKAKDHKIITIRDVGLHGDDSGPKLDFSDISCKDHSGQVCCLFCKTCDSLICPTGVTQVHKQHQLVEIEEAFRMKMEGLNIRKEKLKKHHNNMLQNIETLYKTKEKKHLNFEQTKQSILKQKQTWKEVGDNYAYELGKEITKQWSAMKTAIETESSRAKKLKEQLTDEIKQIENISISDEVSQFFEDTKSLHDLKDISKVNLNYSQLLVFVPGQIIQSNFGIIQDKIHKDKKINITAIREYNTGLSLIHDILPVQFTENTFWIHSVGTVQSIHILTLHPDSTTEVLSKIRIDCQGTAMTRNGDLLIADLTSNLKIVKCNENKLTTSKYNFNPFNVRSINVNRQDQLIVGVVKTLYIDSYIPGGGVVMVMHMDGNLQVMYEFDKKNEPLFTDPKYITSTKNGNIFIIDKITEDSRGRVVILEKGSVSNIYTGHPDINSKNHPFKPEHAVVSQMDNIIVSDMYNNTLHILDYCGHLLFYCNSMENGVIAPTSMAFIEPGTLFIGSSISKLSAKNPNAKIYEVDIPKNI